MVRGGRWVGGSGWGMSPLCVPKGLQVPEGYAKTPVVSRGCCLVQETEEPRGRGRREWGWRPQWAASWAEPRPPLATAARRRRGQRNEARSCSQLQVLSPIPSNRPATPLFSPVLSAFHTMLALLRCPKTSLDCIQIFVAPTSGDG